MIRARTKSGAMEIEHERMDWRDREGRSTGFDEWFQDCQPWLRVPAPGKLFQIEIPEPLPRGADGKV